MMATRRHLQEVDAVMDPDLQSFSAEDESKAACSDDGDKFDESGNLVHSSKISGRVVEQEIAEALQSASKPGGCEEFD